jgi:hypothetical protein
MFFEIGDMDSKDNQRVSGAFAGELSFKFTV